MSLVNDLCKILTNSKQEIPGKLAELRKSSYGHKANNHRQKYRRVDQKFGQPRQSNHITFDAP